MNVPKKIAYFFVVLTGMLTIAIGYQDYRHRMLVAESEVPMLARSLKTLVETNTAVLEVPNGSNRIKEANRTCSEMFGYPVGGMDDLSMSRILPFWFGESHREKMLAAMDKASRGLPLRRVSAMNCTAVKADGTEIKVLVRVYMGNTSVFAYINLLDDVNYYVMPPQNNVTENLHR